MDPTSVILFNVKYTKRFSSSKSKLQMTFDYLIMGLLKRFPKTLIM